MLPPSRLVQLRTLLGLSQEDFARVLGVSFATVNRWENGHSSPIGTNLEVYRALDVALRAGKSAAAVLGTRPLEPGRLLHRIFNSAYGGRP